MKGMNNMNYTNIKKLLKLAHLLKLYKEVATDKGILVCNDDIEVGKEVYLINENGDTIPAPEGEYVASNERYIVEGGIVKTIEEKEASGVTEVETMEEEELKKRKRCMEEMIEQPCEPVEPAIPELEAKVTDLESKIAELEAMIAEKDALLAEQESTIADLTAKLAELDAMMSEPAAEPAEMNDEKEHKFNMLEFVKNKH